MTNQSQQEFFTAPSVNGEKIYVTENTAAVVDLDCGENANQDVGVDICVVRDNAKDVYGEKLEKPSEITLSLGDTLTDTINSSQGNKLEVGSVMPGDDGDGIYFIKVSDDQDPTKSGSVFFAGDVDAGDSFTASVANAGTDKFGSETFVHIYSADGGTLLQTINFHTSCSAPLVIGDQYGSVSLEGAALEGKDSGQIVQIGGPGGTGDDGVTYSINGGDDAALFQVDADTGEVSFIAPPDFENPQDADGDNAYDVIVRATRDDGTFEDKPIDVCVEDDCIKFTENGTTVVVDLDCGTGGNKDLGLDACEVRDDNKFDKPVALTFNLGDALTDEIISSQDSKKVDAMLTGATDDDSTVFVRVSRDDDASNTESKNIFFSGDVGLGDSFTALRENAGRDFGGQTYVHIFDEQNGDLLQTIEFHTSCSQPLVIGDQYGSVSLAGFGFDDDGVLVEYGQTSEPGDDGVTYSIAGGADAALFQVDADTGEVTFINPPDFENPQDAGGDNNYDVIVRATRDDGTFEDKPIEICVEDDPDDEPICVEENTTQVVDLDIAVPCQKDEGFDLCEAKDDKGYGKPSQISLTYDPDATGVNSQGDKAKITGTNDDDDDAFVIVMDKDGNTLFSGDVSKGDTITFNSIDKTLDSQTFIDIYDSQDGALLQSINLHTSCSAPLVIGESFGSVVLAGGGFTANDGTLDTYGGTFDDTDVTYSIVGGADAEFFEVDPTTGEVSFIDAPDFETPQDAGGDNIYDVIVRATSNGDASCFKEVPLQIEVKDVPEPGSLSGTYFCDDDRDGVDDGAPADPDVAGKTVMLFEADGVTPATDIDGNPVAAVLTDDQGDYRFDNLGAGDYVVMFEGTDGKEFIAPDVGGDDTIDSDVTDTADGKTDPVSVVAGEETRDVDAGVQKLPGSLSGRYFCDDDGNGLDDDGPNNGIAGVTAMLLYADGSAAMDIDGNPVAAVLTDTDGDYIFDNLAAGTYTVEFTDLVSGKVLTTQNVDGDASDDIDSDAADLGGGMSEITNIVVIAGRNTPDNDAGVVEPNNDPEITPDAGKGCADENIIVDFSDNYSDPDGDPVSITMINGEAISQGATITLANGVEVTLTTDDEFIFNGEATYSNLDIGEEANEAFTVKVEDSAGNSATASVDVTFCGDANSYASLAASFPATADFNISGTLSDPDAFAVTVSGSGDARFDGVTFENAYCLSFFDPILPGQDIGGDFLDAEGAGVPGVFDPGQISAVNGETAADNMDLIRYIVAQDWENDASVDYDGADVQFAIWELTDNIDTDDWTQFYSAATVANVDAIIADALANGENFTFEGDGKVAGMIWDPNPKTPDVIEQPFIIGFNFDAYDCIC